ncbi:dnaB-like helicase C terminal domain protein [Orientia tsutsugamushi str. UT76]|nr:dnaB-like helicase C terminal domain protein [Orientia tsutsugamushi str. UT76]
MSSQQISTRILSIESEINSSALFNGKISEQDVDKLKTVQDEIQKWNFFIDDAPQSRYLQLDLELVDLNVLII